MSDNKKALSYFNDDELAASVWIGKYAADGEETPDDMHKRLSKEFNRIEEKFIEVEKTLDSGTISNLSEYGRTRKNLTDDSIFQLFKDFKYIVPQGRVMAGLGVGESYRSLSNCLRLPSPKDNYSSIMYSDTMLVSSAKRGCGYGLGISNLRPKDTTVSNAAKTSTGAISFMDRFSNSTREVGQNSRRGACLIDIDIKHPDVLDFIKVKQDLTKITGANISIFLDNDFMKAVENDDDFILRFPCDMVINEKVISKDSLKYDVLVNLSDVDSNLNGFVRKIKAKHYFNEIISAAKKFAEPGVFFRDRFTDFSPSNVYEKYFEEGTNACITGDYNVLTTKGYKKLKDITKEDVISTSFGKEKITHIEVNENLPVWKVTFSDGGELEVTENHIFYGKLKGNINKVNEEIKLKNLKVGDYVKVQKSFNVLEDNYDDYTMNSLYGSLIGDGLKYENFDLSTLKTTGDFVGVLDELFSLNGEIIETPKTQLVKWEASNSDLAKNIRLALLAIGCQSKISGSNKKYVVTISGESIHTYILKSRLETIHPVKGKKLKDLLKKYSLTGNTWYANVKSIEFVGNKDVYDIFCEGSDTWVVDGYLNRGCGEQPMAVYDTCRLIVINLFSIVKNPFTENAEIDYELLYKISYEQLRLGDDLVELEIEYLNRIIEKIKSDEGSLEEKQIELTLWQNVRDMALSGRRVGCGITALADMIAGIGLKYDSDEAINLTNEVMKVKIQAELDSSIDLAILRGKFEKQNGDKEFVYKNGLVSGKNDWYEFILKEFPELSEKMYKFGRRNVNFNTIAPCGSVGILTQTSSGCEPVFSPYYMRRKKINPNDKNNRIDFTDQNGDNWQEYPVVHQKFKNWYDSQQKENYDEIEKLSKTEIENWYKKSPWFESVANDISWIKRIEMQSTLQKYVTSAISSTLNLPSLTTKEEIYNIYMEAWKQGLKGVTVYVDGSRTGVMITEESNKKQSDDKHPSSASKRPKSIHGKVVRFNNNGEKWISVVGILNDKPYEIFTGLSDKLHIPLDIEHGDIVKVKIPTTVLDEQDNEVIKMVGRYDFSYKNHKGETVTVEGLSTTFREEFWNYAKLISGLLRHNMPIEYVVKVISSLNLGTGSINSWKNGVIRTLKKFIKDGTEVGEKCPECGGKIIRAEGCKKCSDCGYSVC